MLRVYLLLLSWERKKVRLRTSAWSEMRLSGRSASTSDEDTLSHKRAEAKDRYITLFVFVCSSACLRIQKSVLLQSYP